MGLTPAKSYANAKKYAMVDERFANAAIAVNATFAAASKFYGMTFLHQVVPSTTSVYAASSNNACCNNMDSQEGEGGFGGSTNYKYAGCTPWAIPVLIFGIKQRISDMTLLDGFYHHVIPFPSGNPYKATVTDAAMTKAEFLAAYGDKYVVTNMVVYSNEMDGTIAQGNGRTVLGYINDNSKSTFSDLYMRFYAYQYGTANPPLAGEFDLICPILGNFFASNLTYGTYGETFNSYSMLKMQQLFSGLDIVCRFNVAQTPGVAVTHQNVQCFRMYDSSETINSHMNAINVPFTFNAYEAQWRNTADFDSTDWIPTGQPTDGTGGGIGTGDNDSDDITELDPDVSVVSTFNQQYACTAAQLGDFADYLWTSTFLDDLKLLFNDPMEGVISCRMFPFSLTSHDGAHVGASTPINIGNVVTTANGHPIGNGYSCRFDLGSISVDEYYGSALDYEPYTKLAIYLPYIGIKDISTNDFMGKTLAVKYIVDITTGACIAQVWAGTQLLYTYDGKIGVEIPVSSTNAAQFAAGLAMTGLASIGGFVASGGNALAAAGTVLATAKGVASNQFHINHGGANSPFAGFYMPQYPFLIINRPIQSLPSNFGAMYGFPSNVARKLSTLTGFTQVDEIQLSAITNSTAYATQNELDEIERLLKEGVIL